MLKIKNELATEALGVEIVKVGKKYTKVIVPKGELHKVLMRLGVRYAIITESENSTLYIMVYELKQHDLSNDITFTSKGDVKLAKWSPDNV